ncbi:MAG: hypothetical protein WKG03_05255, partial [Telluria sp.]
KLLAIVSRTGSAQRLTYSNGVTNDSSIGRHPANAPVCPRVQLGMILEAGLLLCVTDDAGRQLQFERDPYGRISKMIDPAGESYLYAYDGISAGCTNSGAFNAIACEAGNLTSVTYPGGRTKTYHYNEASRINGGAACPGVKPVGPGFGGLIRALTGITDENGSRHLSWTYDCKGKATSSEVGQGNEKVTLAYGAIDVQKRSVTTVRYDSGTAASPLHTETNYIYGNVLGVRRNIGMSAPCIECGAYASRTYDASGNQATLVDWNGNKATLIHDLARNLETSRIDADGTPLRRVTSTTWHPTLRLPATVAEAKRITRYAYDDAGNLLTKTEQATSDTNGSQGLGATLIGAARTWTNTYEASGRVKTTRGPRRDIDDTTTYHYDQTNGNLTSMVNALGHTTTVSEYDVNGRPHRIVAPNGVVTAIDYTVRGWVKIRTVSAGVLSETTGYEYDYVGQLKKVTLPGGAVMNYDYDDSRRLTGVSDSLGNSIIYTPDFLGNRVLEQVKDPAGTLTQQVSRQYDELNRLKQQTGAAQ